MSSVPNVIHFNCQSCGMLLTVPAEYAGVTGPCPHCGTTITSPAATPASSLPGPSWPQAQNAASAPPAPAQTEVPQAGLPVSRTQAPAQAVPGSWESPIPSQGATLPPSAGGGSALDPSWPPTRTDLPAPSSWAPSAHPVMDSVLQLPTVHPQASPPFPPSPPPRTAPLAAQSTTVPSQRFRSQRSSSSGRKGPALLALLMAMMVLAGTAWFFRDQLRVAWNTHMLAEETEVDALEFHPPPSGPETPANFDPTEPPKLAAPASPPVANVQPAPPADSATPDNPAPADASPPIQIERPGMPATPAPDGPSAPIAASPERPNKTPTLVEVPSPVPPASENPATEESPPKTAPAAASPPLVADVPEDSRPALEALKEFLSAGTWEERLKVVQGAELMRPLMQSYYASMPDGPLAVTKIALIRHDKAPQTGPPHCVFQIGGGEVKRPLPIMVEQSPDGWKVDWLTFTEFKDNLLARFMEGYQEGPKRFHVLVRRTHYFDDDVPEMDKKICVEVQSPTPPFVGSVFAVRGTPVANILDRYLGWEVDQAAAVVELEWRREGDTQWVELTGLPQFNWRNAMAGEVVPPPQAAPTVPVAVPVRD